MRLPSYLVGFVLALLLASTTPMGTGAGTHQFDLLHPLFSHVHFVNGQLVTHEELARQLPIAFAARATPAPALAAVNAAGPPDGGLGISPLGLRQAVDFTVAVPIQVVVEDVSMPTGHEEAPPEPPPL